jgi:hypothetical protein
MRSANSVLMLIVGAVGGVAFVLSCGDGLPRVDAGDAGSCNCPAAEPPIASRIVERVAVLDVPANSMQQSNAVGCPPDAVVLTGGCDGGEGQVPNIILEQSAPGTGGWHCSWRNPSNASISVRAIVHCLMPAS